MQLLGNLFEYALAKNNAELNIFGATSGDTGSAAEYAMRGKKGIRVFMLSPHKKMSAFQTAQMFSLQDPNIFNIAVEGVFDDCQDMVKAVSNDLEFKARQKIGTVNSINWARVVAQVVYYFRGYLAATTGNDQKVSFTVPSGNFGNICAGHIARMMGLPIDKLVVATNENDVLDEFFRTGVYRVRKASETYHTSSPSMDISKASNFERFVYDLVGRDAERTRALFQQGGDATAASTCPASRAATATSSSCVAEYGFVSGRSTHADRLDTIRDVLDDYDITIDTHTADGIKVAREYMRAGRADDRAGNRAGGQVQRNHPRSAGHRRRASGRLRGHRIAAAEVRRDAARRRPDEGLHRRAHGPVNDERRCTRTPMLAVREALDFLLAAARPVDGNRNACRRWRPTAACWPQDQASTLNVPSADNTQMDGYAVRAADCASGERDAARSASASRPGRSASRSRPGTAARIFTGAMIPEGADAVVMQEQCEAQAPDQRRRAPRAASRRMDPPHRRGHPRRLRDPARRHAPAQPGTGTGRVGRAGQPAGVAQAARGGVLHRRRAGDAGRAPLAPGAIYNSNRFTLRALLENLGCEITDFGIVPDTLDATRDTLRSAAREHDLIITSGGVSVGEEDHIKPAVEAEGRLNMWQIAVKPGKPLAFGEVRPRRRQRLFPRPAGQSGVELHHLPAVRAAVHPAPAGRDRAGRAARVQHARRFRLAEGRPPQRVPARDA